MFGNPMSFNGMDVLVKDAQQQRRTPRDVKGPWVRPRVPSKRAGRRGTRRAWKRRNPPHQVWYFREPDDLVVMDRAFMFPPRHGKIIIATPRQWDAIRKQIKHTT